MGTDDIPHGYRKSSSFMGKKLLKSYLLKVLAKLCYTRERKHKLIIFFYTYYFTYLDFFTDDVLCLGHNLIFEVFLSILTAFVEKLGAVLKFIPLVSLWSKSLINTKFFVIWNCKFFHQF